jgi:BirA family biotin operon repressor/biotin-[acetyl-CoA-carboxylase] ligase
MSIVLFPPPHLAPAVPGDTSGCAWLTALGAVATAEVVVAWTGRDATIKWPNDVRVDGHKIAGILVERASATVRTHGAGARARPGKPGCGAVIGIGLNANLDHADMSPDLVARATSLKIIRGGAPVDRSELTRDLIRRLDHWYDKGRSGGAETLNAPLCARSEHLGRLVRVATPTGERIGHLVEIDLYFGLTLAVGREADRESLLGDASRLIRVPLADILTLEPAVQANQVCEMRT